jgi:lysophospholipase L1-like esterase
MMSLLLGADDVDCEPADFSPRPVSSLSGGAALEPFFAALRSAGTRPVHILQIGDSHTAADAISNALRRELQGRFGNGGRGMMAPGRPYPTVVTWDVTAQQSAGWRTAALLDASSDGVPLGLSGFSQTAGAAHERLTITADDAEHGFTGLRVCALTAPGAGRIAVTLGDQSVILALDSEPGVACRTIESADPSSRVVIETLDARPVAISSLTMLSGRCGVLHSNLGVIGAQIAHLERLDEAVIAAELAAAAPDLLILAFGTNEGRRLDLSAEDYEAGLRRQLARLRFLAGGEVPILLMGPPDIAEGEDGGPPRTPLFLTRVRETQRRLAVELGLAFWDMEQAMGGRGAVRRWHADGLMHDDLIHFNRHGGDRIGRMLFADLAAAGLPDEAVFSQPGSANA